jgi:hypothetical protein
MSDAPVDIESHQEQGNHGTDAQRALFSNDNLMGYRGNIALCFAVKIASFIVLLVDVTAGADRDLLFYNLIIGSIVLLYVGHQHSKGVTFSTAAVYGVTSAVTAYWAFLAYLGFWNCLNGSTIGVMNWIVFGLYLAYSLVKYPQFAYVLAYPSEYKAYEATVEESH